MANHAERRIAFHVEKVDGYAFESLLSKIPSARPPGCRDQLAGDRPGLIRGQEYRDERDLRGVHHAADGIAARRVRSEVLPLRIFRGYAQRVARAASRLGVRSVRVVPGWMQLTVIP